MRAGTVRCFRVHENAAPLKRDVRPVSVERGSLARFRVHENAAPLKRDLGAD